MAIIVEHHGAVRTVIINRPERRNSLDPETMAEIGAAFTEAEHDDDVRVVILTAGGHQAFCAGMDLRAFAEQQALAEQRAAGGSGSQASPVAPSVGTEVFVERIYPKPIVAAVNGAAVGGGFGLVLGCDIVVAAEHATFGLPEVQRGLIGAGAGSRAALRLPPAVTLELILTGQPIDAARAYGLGIVNRVVPAAEVRAVATALAERIAANGPMAVRVSKEIVYEVRHLIDGADMKAIRAKAAPVMASADAKEGTTAFAEKRTPLFTGR
jgi:enoyl-CoA hydratase